MTNCEDWSWQRIIADIPTLTSPLLGQTRNNGQFTHWIFHPALAPITRAEGDRTSVRSLYTEMNHFTGNNRDDLLWLSGLLRTGTFIPVPALFCSGDGGVTAVLACVCVTPSRHHTTIKCSTLIKAICCKRLKNQNTERSCLHYVLYTLQVWKLALFTLPLRRSG